jgi:hypothetical protein
VNLRSHRNSLSDSYFLLSLVNAADVAPANDLCEDAAVSVVNAPFRAGFNLLASTKGRCGSTNEADRGKGVFYSFRGTYYDGSKLDLDPDWQSYLTRTLFRLA